MIPFTLQDVAGYFQRGKAPIALLSILRATVRIFNFGVERANRLRRFVLVTRDYASGSKVPDIAAKYECSPHTVLRHARIAGLSKRPKSPVPGRKNGILADYIAGKPIAAIAKQYGVNQSRVSQIASDAGVLRRQFNSRGEK